MLHAADPYYNDPLEKMKNVLSDKRNSVKRLCNWTSDFIVGFMYLFSYCYY